MLMCMYLCALDEFNSVFVYYRFNISCIRKNFFFVNINLFLSFSKMSQLSINPKCWIYLEIFLSLSLSMCVYFDLYDYTCQYIIVQFKKLLRIKKCTMKAKWNSFEKSLHNRRSRNNDRRRSNRKGWKI